MHIGSSDRENDFEVVKEIDTLKFTFFTKEGDGFNVNQSLLYTHLTEVKGIATIIFEFPNMVYLDSTTIGRIIKSYKQIETFHKDFIVRVSPIVYSLLRNMDITKLFKIEEYVFPDKIEAIKEIINESKKSIIKRK